MFQTEPILWLQAHSSAALTWFLSAVTLLGYAPTYVAAVLTLAFGFRLRAGLSVLLTLLVCGLLTEGLKNGLALPRPSDVDSRIAALGVVPQAPHASGIARGGAASFWSLPPPEAIAAVRSLPPASYGFPSGHVGAALAFVLAAGLFCGSRRFAIAGLLWPVLMGLSRMYLGRHFLADVLGGLVVGGVAVVAALLLLRGLDRSPEGPPARLIPLATVTALVACLLPFVSLLDPENVGRLAGFAAAYAVLRLRGFPPDHATLAQRRRRVGASAFVFLAAWGATRALLIAAGWSDARLAEAVASALVMALTLLGGVAIARRRGWYAAR
jgi:membrane-associated phospholipid phosphatase